MYAKPGATSNRTGVDTPHALNKPGPCREVHMHMSLPLTWSPLTSSNFSLVRSSMWCCSAVKLLLLGGRVPLARLSARDAWEPKPTEQRLSSQRGGSMERGPEGAGGGRERTGKRGGREMGGRRGVGREGRERSMERGVQTGARRGPAE